MEEFALKKKLKSNDDNGDIVKTKNVLGVLSLQFGFIPSFNLNDLPYVFAHAIFINNRYVNRCSVDSIATLSLL